MEHFCNLLLKKYFGGQDVSLMMMMMLTLGVKRLNYKCESTTKVFQRDAARQ